MLAVARAVLVQFPDMSLDDLAAKLATSLGGKKPEMREVLLDSGLFISGLTPEQSDQEQALPAYVVAVDRGYNKKQPPVYGVYATTQPWQLVIPFSRIRLAQLVCDGLNLGLERDRAVARALAVDELINGDGGTVRIDRPTDENVAFVCDALNRERAWGPFESIEEAHAWRALDDYTRVWTVTTRWPYAPYYPPACYRLFRPEETRSLPRKEPDLTDPIPRSLTNAEDMTPRILEAARDYLSFQSEANRMYGPCRDAFERLRALLLAAAAPPLPRTREKLYVHDRESGKTWGPFASQVDAEAFVNFASARCELALEPDGTELLPPAAFHGRWPLWEGQ